MNCCAALLRRDPTRNATSGVMAATMDHSSIRALNSAFPHFFAGLPRSESGDHRGGCSLKTFEGSPHRSRASRSWLGLVLLGKQLDRHLLRSISEVGYLGDGRHVSCQVPDESTELSSDRHADLGHLHLAAEVELAKALCEAQLRLPGDVSDGLWLALLADLLLASNAGREAVGPSRLDQDAAHMAVAGACN